MNRYFGTRTITSSDRGYTCHYLEDTTINAFNGPGIRRALQQLCGHNRVGLPWKVFGILQQHLIFNYYSDRHQR